MISHMDFLFEGLRCCCKMCEHYEVNPKNAPCNSCLHTVKNDRRVAYEVDGSQFAPADREYFGKLQSLICQYGNKLQKAEEAYAAIQKEIRKAAREYGVDVKDFHYARGRLSKRPKDVRLRLRMNEQ